MSFHKIILFFLNFFDLFQQKKIISLINDKFSEPIIVFDVGAHHGETIQLFEKKLKLKKIYSFEASPENFKKLKENISNNMKTKFEIFNLALGDKISRKYLNQTLESSSSTLNELNQNSTYYKKKLKILKINNEKSYVRQILVSITTLDEFIEKKNIKKIDLLKIDTEGYEFKILKGLSKYYKKIKLIYFEHHYDDMIIKNYKFSDIHDMLKNRGFKMIKKSKMIFRKSFEYVYENQV